MQRAAPRQTPGRQPAPRPLLPRPLRLPAAALLAACAAVTIVLAVHVAGDKQPGRLDAAMDPQLAAALGRFPALLLRLPGLGDQGPVIMMTAVLVIACLAARRWTGAILVAVAEPAASGLTDTVAGAAIGTGTALAVALTLDWAATLRPAAPRAPGPFIRPGR